MSDRRSHHSNVQQFAVQALAFRVQCASSHVSAAGDSHVVPSLQMCPSGPRDNKIGTNVPSVQLVGIEALSLCLNMMVFGLMLLIS